MRFGAYSNSYFQGEHHGLVWVENKKIIGHWLFDSVRWSYHHLGCLYASADFHSSHEAAPACSASDYGFDDTLEEASKSRAALAVPSGFATRGSIKNEWWEVQALLEWSDDGHPERVVMFAPVPPAKTILNPTVVPPYVLESQNLCLQEVWTVSVSNVWI